MVGWLVGWFFVCLVFLFVFFFGLFFWFFFFFLLVCFVSLGQFLVLVGMVIFTADPHERHSSSYLSDLLFSEENANLSACDFPSKCLEIY